MATVLGFLEVVAVFNYLFSENTKKYKDISRKEDQSRPTHQSCKSGRAFRVGLGFGPGSGLTFRKTSGLFRARCDAFKKQNYSVTLYLFYVD